MKGRLVPTMHVSAAIPGIFPAVTVDGRQLYGGNVASIPVTQALEMGHRLSPLSLTVPARAARSRTWAISPVTWSA
jgi:NTE family protein